MSTVALVYEENYFWHHSYLYYGPDVEEGYQIETPAPRRRMLDLFAKKGLLGVTVRPRAVLLEQRDLQRVHDIGYIAAVAAANDTGGSAGEFTPFGPGGYDIARLSAGGAYAALAAVVGGDAERAFALVRPPGHHAERDRGRGYCIFANIAVGVEKLRAEYGVGRVAVVDWDVHHGNGTQSIYYDDPATLTISLHQDRLYPHDSGLLDETGNGAAVGTNVNIPLPPGSGRGAYLHAMTEVVVPALEHFAPELIVVACGFDAGAFDPNARMMLSATAFAEMTQQLIELSASLCAGRLVLVQEGGYSPLHVPFCGLAVVSALLDRPERDNRTDPGAYIDSVPGQELQAHQRTYVSDARAAARSSGALT